MSELLFQRLLEKKQQVVESTLTWAPGNWDGTRLHHSAQLAAWLGPALVDFFRSSSLGVSYDYLVSSRV